MSEHIIGYYRCDIWCVWGSGYVRNACKKYILRLKVCKCCRKKPGKTLRFPMMETNPHNLQWHWFSKSVPVTFQVGLESGGMFDASSPTMPRVSICAVQSGAYSLLVSRLSHDVPARCKSSSGGNVAPLTFDICWNTSCFGHKGPIDSI